LNDIGNALKPGGVAAINVLVEKTTYLDMFEPNNYYLFGETELAQCLKHWDIVE